MKQLRLKAGLKVEEVAIALDVATSSINNWEQGRHEPRLYVSQFNRLCQLYSVDGDTLEVAIAESMNKRKG